jgi:hypothetical protein
MLLRFGTSPADVMSNVQLCGTANVAALRDRIRIHSLRGVLLSWKLTGWTFGVEVVDRGVGKCLIMLDIAYF